MAKIKKLNERARRHRVHNYLKMAVRFFNSEQPEVMEAPPANQAA